MKAILLCVAIALTLPGCEHLAEYTGPNLRFSLGWNGIDAGVTLYGKKPAALSLAESGNAFNALASPATSSGKTPAPLSP